MPVPRTFKLVVLPLAALAIGAAAYFGMAPAGAVVQAEPAQHASRGAIRDVITGKGVVSYEHQADLKSPRSGRLDQFLAVEGAPVRAGQPLFHVADPQGDVDAATRAAERSKVMARIKALQHEVDVLARLRDAGGVSEDEVAQKRLELELAQRDLEIAVQDDTRRVNANELATVRVPFDGVVMSATAAPGQWVGAGETLATVAGGSSRDIVAYLDATDMARLKPGQAVDFSDEPDNTNFRHGRVKSISQVVAGSQRQNSVKVVVQPTSDVGDLRYSQQLYLEFIVRDSADVLRVPKDLVRVVQGRSVVYVDDGKTVSARTIETAPGDRNFEVVTAGIGVNERLVRQPVDGRPR